MALMLKIIFSGNGVFRILFFTLHGGGNPVQLSLVLSFEGLFVLKERRQGKVIKTRASLPPKWSLLVTRLLCEEGGFLCLTASKSLLPASFAIKLLSKLLSTPL